MRFSPVWLVHRSYLTHIAHDTLAVLLCWLGAVVAFWASPLAAIGLSEQLLEVEPSSSSNNSLLDISSSYSSFDFLGTK